MAKMSEQDLRALLQAQKADALASMTASFLSEERAKALDYYYGDMGQDMPAGVGRSKAVSTDVADTVEGLMPTLMDIFTSGDEVVRFEPVSEEDEPAAEQETDYVNHVFMQQNPGFMVLYNFCKDTMISKNGFVKVYWEREEKEHKETYRDLDEVMLAMLVANPRIEVIEKTEKDFPGDAGTESDSAY